MKVVVDIPYWLYDAMQEHREPIYSQSLGEAVRDGVPIRIQKGHGRLIILSEDVVKKEYTSFGFSCQSWISDVGLSNATVAIIEADNAENEG